MKQVRLPFHLVAAGAALAHRPGLGGPLGFDHIDRTFVVRIEALR